MFQRRTREVTWLLPGLCLRGLSQGDFELALRRLLGLGAPLSPSPPGCGYGGKSRSRRGSATESLVLL